MNSKSVLSKIMTLLSLENEVNFTDAKDAQGNILQSPTFDVDESVEVISEDGTKSPAPDGEHEIELTDSEGNKVVIRIQTKDGKIVSRENVEEANPADLEKVDEEVVDKEAEEIKMADATTEEVKALPNTTEESEANVVKEGESSEDPIIRMSYRIDELEKAMKMMVEKMAEESPVDEEAIDEEEPEIDEEGVAMAKEEEEKLPKLDGAPLDTKLSSDHLHTPNNNYGKKVASSQGSFLSKLYR
jgi:hypothetical protein